MFLLIRLSLFILALNSLLVGQGQFACANEGSAYVEVITTNGRLIRGMVDSKTDSRDLVLTIAGEDIQVTSHLPWTVISSIQLGDQNYSIEELKAALPAIQTDFNLRPAFGGWTADGTHISQVNADEPVKLPPAPVPSGSTLIQENESPLKVTSLQMTASVVNWDRDPERDGLLVEIQPLADTGELIPVEGQLECELIIQRKTWEGGEYIERLDDRFSVLERWSQPVNIDKFTSQGITLKLPYRVRHPESQLIIDSHALLHARLKVPGQGVFEASYDIVRLRPYSRIRDDFQLYEGTRYFPQERTQFIPRRSIDHYHFR